MFLTKEASLREGDRLRWKENAVGAGAHDSPKRATHKTVVVFYG